ncbi:MAG: hypothetical protein OXH22_09230 [Chloroflexi bacterium]|nr:hypothetical protein [Chloroflexota bacterium]
MAREPQRDWRSEVARLDTSASHENLNTQVTIFRWILRLIFLPFWLPFYLYGVAKRRRAIKEFALERAKNRFVDAALISEIALAWAEAHPEEYRWANTTLAWASSAAASGASSRARGADMHY